MTIIKTIGALHAHLRKGHRHFVTSLAGGLVLSRRHIGQRKNGRFDLSNTIDDTAASDQPASALTGDTGIGRAMKEGRFFCED